MQIHSLPCMIEAVRCAWQSGCTYAKMTAVGLTMLNVQLPESLLQQIEAAGVTSSDVDAFVEQAVREKLAIANLSPAERRKKFFDFRMKCAWQCMSKAFPKRSFFLNSTRDDIRTRRAL
jgi:hypothetical protein